MIVIISCITMTPYWRLQLRNNCVTVSNLRYVNDIYIYKRHTDYSNVMPSQLTGNENFRWPVDYLVTTYPRIADLFYELPFNSQYAGFARTIDWAHNDPIQWPISTSPDFY